MSTEREEFAKRTRATWVEHHPNFLAAKEAIEQAQHAAENQPFNKSASQYAEAARQAYGQIQTCKRSLASVRATLEKEYDEANDAEAV